MGLKFGSTFGTLQVGMASRIGLHVSRTKPITGNFFASVRAQIASRGLALAPVAA